MWILFITAAIAYVMGQITVLIAVIVLGTSRSLSTQGRRSAPPVHTGRPASPDSPTGNPQCREGDLGRWSFPRRYED